MFDIKALLRKNIRSLEPYTSAREESAGQKGIWLDANENTFGSVIAPPLNRYPDPLQIQLKAKIAGIKQVDPQQVFLGNGSDEGIDLLIRAFCEPRQEQVMVLPPTYSMYEVCAAINDVGIIKTPLNALFRIDVEKVLMEINPRLKLIFICSPNNPTGNCFEASVIETILRRFPGLVVIDEAYTDFVPHKSWLPNLSRYQNLVILQTFSKAWGLANIRLGMAFASPAIIQVLNKIKYPYSVTGESQKTALKALERIAIKDSLVQQIIEERELLGARLKSLPFVKKVYPSEANFLLVKMKSAQQVYQHLLKHNIIVRDRSTMIHCQNCLRITVGMPSENRQLMDVLLKYKTS